MKDSLSSNIRGYKLNNWIKIIHCSLFLFFVFCFFFFPQIIDYLFLIFLWYSLFIFIFICLCFNQFFFLNSPSVNYKTKEVKAVLLSKLWLSQRKRIVLCKNEVETLKLNNIWNLFWANFSTILYFVYQKFTFQYTLNLIFSNYLSIIYIYIFFYTCAQNKGS